MNWKFPTYDVNESINWDAIDAQYDWFRDMKGVPQDPIWHAEGDVYVHTKMVVEALVQLPEFQALAEQDKHILFAAALLHDVEKRSTTTTEILDGKERIVSPRHAKKGEFTARTILYRDIPTPFAIREQIVKLVRKHGLPLWAITQDDPRRAVIGASLMLNTTHLSILAKADALGRHCKDQDDLLYRIDLFNELCHEHNCWGKPRVFPSEYGRYLFLTRPEVYPDYEPYDDLKFEVIMMCALPGAGKDTYIHKHLDLPILSLDDIRREHHIDPTDKKKNGLVVQMAKEQAKVYMRKRTSFIFNATNITSEMRRKWVSLFTDYGGRVRIIYLEVPHAQLKKQNQNRPHPVPETVVERMIEKLEVPGFEEAHEVEYVVG